MKNPTLALIVATCLGALAPLEAANAYPLNPWGAETAEKTLILNPFLYWYAGPLFSPYMYVGYGFGHHFDIYGGVSVNLAPKSAGGSSFGSVEVFPRYFIGGKVGVSPHIFWFPTAKTLIVAPEVHYWGRTGRFAFTGNAGWRPAIVYGDGGGFDAGTLFVMAAPELYIVDQFAVFAEVHDYLYLPDASNVNLFALGVWFAIDKNAVHSFSIAGQMVVPFADPAPNSFSGGIWYATSFGLAKGE